MDAALESLDLHKLADLMYFASRHPENGDRNSLIIRLIYGHALKLTEALQLRWSQFDLFRGKLTLTRRRGKREIVRDLTLEELNALRDVREGLKEKDRGGPNDRVFVSVRGKPLTRNAIHKMIVKAAEDAEIDQVVNARILRRSAGMRVAAKTKDVDAVQTIMRVKKRSNVVELFPRAKPKKQPNPWV